MRNARTRIALLMLCALLTMAAASGITVSRTCGRLLDAAAAVGQNLQSHPADVPDAIAALRERWKSDSAVLHLFVPNQTLVELNASIAKLDAMHKADCEELTAELAAIRADLQWIRARK